MQAATVAMLAFRDTETGPQPATTPNQQGTHRKRYGALKLEKLKYNWDTQDRYVKLLNLKLKVTYILETRVYEISDLEKVLVIKNCLGWEGLLLI